MSDKSRLVILAFPEEDAAKVHLGGDIPPMELNVSVKDSRAGSAWKTIEKAAKGADVELKDAALIYKTKDGRFQIKQTMDVTSGKGARRGGFWGFLIGLLLGGPIGGALGGAVIGAIYGKVVDKGINDKFLKDVGQAMKPMSSAIFLVIKEEDYEKSIAYLKSFDTKIFESEFDEEAGQAMEDAMENEDVAKVVKEQMG